MTLFDHIYWIAGCCLGFLAGDLIPISFEGVEFVLTALFVTLFTEQWLTHKRHFSALVGVGCTAACLLLIGSQYFLIPAMVMIATLLIICRKTGRRQEDA